MVRPEIADGEQRPVRPEPQIVNGFVVLDRRRAAASRAAVGVRPRMGALAVRLDVLLAPRLQIGVLALGDVRPRRHHVGEDVGGLLPQRRKRRHGEHREQDGPRRSRGGCPEGERSARLLRLGGPHRHHLPPFPVSMRYPTPHTVATTSSEGSASASFSRSLRTWTMTELAAEWSNGSPHTDS